MEDKKRFKLYKSGKLWCCAAVAFGTLVLGTVNGQADDTTPATTPTSQVSTVSPATTSPTTVTNAAATSSTPASSAPASANANANDTTASSAPATTNTLNPAVTTTTLNVNTLNAAPVTANAVTTAAYAATNNNLTTADTLDISAYQPNISEATFQQYHNQGINNVVVKLSESTSWTNPYAQQQVSRAQAAGMNVSAYHFVRFTTAAQAQQEARLFAQTARNVGLGPDTLMIADVEQVPQTQYAGIVNNLNVFWQTLDSLGYTNHGVYTGLAYDRQYNVSSTVGRARTWVAMYYYDYSANATRSNYVRSLGYGAWQYTDRWNGSIDASIDFGMFANYSGHQTTSAASLDNFNINANGNTLDVRGWFADNNNEGKNNRYVILLDQDNGNSELARQQVAAVSRPDVANVYGDIYGAGNSGFHAQFALNGSLADAIANGHHIVTVIRYTSSSDGNSDYNDHWFNGVVLNKNVAYLDSMTTSQAGIHVSGWHAADQSINRPYDYVILYDATTKTEIARQRVNASRRDEVAQANPDVYNSANSGFSADFDMNAALRTAIQNGDTLQVISRYTDDANGNGNMIDYWFNAQNYNQNQAWIDDFSIYNNQLRVTGWHAADQSVVEPNQWIILIDDQTGKEIARTQAVTTKRTSVQAAYPNILNADNSGFVANFDVVNTPGLRATILAGHSIRVVARYSDDNQDGEGHKTDYWFTTAKNFYNNQSAQWLDSFNIKGNSIEVTGWDADNRSVAASAMYVILRDSTTGQELGRQEVALADRQRPDIANKYPQIANADLSGFKAAFALNNQLAQALQNGDQLQVVVRYTDNEQTGNGNYADHWFAPKTFNDNAAFLDDFAIAGNSLHVKGWHAADQSVGKKYHYVIVYDATKKQEITRRQVSNSSRSDVKQAYPNIYGSGNSGFAVDIPLTAAMTNGDQIQLISRYTDDPAGNGNYTDYWFAPKAFNANNAYLDNVTFANNRVHVAGWHATDQSVAKPYHFVILYDATTGREVKRQLVDTVARPDVAKAYSDTYNAGGSGFSGDITVNTAALQGHQLQVISRYSDSQSGEGHYIDYWFKPVNVTIK